MIAATTPAVSPSHAVPAANGAPRLLDQVRAAARSRRYGPHTEEAFAGWIRRFVLFHGKRHPAQMAEAEVVRFLSHLAVEEHVSASAQVQARAAIVFLYRHVLNRPLGRLDDVVRAKPSPPARPRATRRPPDREEIVAAKPDPLR
ncbi:MAG TPA: phage integrase N-terminal SAM-like domain-containing protein [Candidatus Anammoximicrobium sp.]|nr:phage integrase N-terminal SAM-like domain-containing protein [Candidatus Anammoximicrobium sp.]